MAKLNETSIVEQHVEKGVFGIAVLVLLYVAFNWIPSSPRRIGPDGLKPGEIDAHIKAEPTRVLENNNAGAKRDRDEHANQADDEVDYVKQIKSLAKAEAFDSMGELTQLSPPGPKYDDFITTTERVKITLAEMVKAVSAPGRPRVKGSLELPRMEDEELTDKPTVHLAAVFDRRELATEWSKLLRSTVIDVNIVVVDVKVEVRELLPDGTWSEPCAVDGFKLSPLNNNGEIAVDADGNPLSVPTLVEYDGDNKEDVLDSIDEIGDLYWQEYILQPPYPQIYLRTGEWGTWRVNLPKNEVSDLLENETIKRRFRTPVEKRGPTRPVTPDKIRRRRPDPRGSPGPGIDPRGAPGRSPDISPDAAITPGNLVAIRTTRNTDVPLQLGAATEAEEDTVELEVVPIPTIEKQIQEGKLLILVHDQSLDSSKVYQYRVRLVLLNPLYAHDSKDVAEDNPDDVLVASIKTPFSDWSQRVAVPKATEFFITGSNPTNGAVRVTVFTRALGQRVLQGFTVKRGQEIGSEQKIQVVNPDTGETERRTVDFSTGVVITDLDFSRKVPRGAIERSTVEMLFLDESGRLGSRIGLLDSESSRLKQLRQEVEHAKAAAAGE